MTEELTLLRNRGLSLLSVSFYGKTFDTTSFCDSLVDAVKKMLDTSCDADYEKRLSDFIRSQKDVIRVDLLQSRMFGNKVYIDLEIATDGDKTLREVHQVAESVHANVEKSFPEIKHIMIHVNPAE